MGEMSPIMLRIRKGFALGFFIGYDPDFGYSLALTVGFIALVIDFKKRRMESTPLFEFSNEWKR